MIFTLENRELDRTANHIQAQALSQLHPTNMSSNTGIQDLMAAETRASQIVAEARIGKLSFRWLCWIPFALVTTVPPMVSRLHSHYMLLPLFIYFHRISNVRL